MSVQRTLSSSLSSSYFSDEFDAGDIEIAGDAIFRMSERRYGVSRTRWGGSRAGRAPNKNRGFQEGAIRIQRDYFGSGGEPPVYSERDFERRYRVPRVVFNKVYSTVREDPFFEQRRNATGLMQSHPIQKITGVFRILAYGQSADATDEYIRLSESTVTEALHRFMNLIVTKLGPEFLRQPTRRDIERVMARMEARVFPCCIGSVDCSHFVWKQCPKAWQGQYQYKDGKRSIVMEIVAD